MIAAALAAILVTMTLAVVRAFVGPSVYDRILAVNMFGTKTVLLIAALSFLGDRPDMLDIAIAYALINFVGYENNFQTILKSYFFQFNILPDV